MKEFLAFLAAVLAWGTVIAIAGADLPVCTEAWNCLPPYTFCGTYWQVRGPDSFGTPGQILQPQCSPDPTPCASHAGDLQWLFGIRTDLGTWLRA